MRGCALPPASLHPHCPLPSSPAPRPLQPLQGSVVTAPLASWVMDVAFWPGPTPPPSDFLF